MKDAKKKRIFTGAATALVTPMNTDGSIDLSSLGALIETQIKAGIDALLVLGTTGEASTLSDDEKSEIINYSAEKIGGRVPLIVGCGSNCTAQTVRLGKLACEAGADALLAVSPYYNKASERGLIKHYLTLAESVNKPIILYNVPSRTGVNITLPVYREIAWHDNICAIKEASGNISQIAEIAAELSDQLDIYSGNDDMILPVLSLGGAGVISVLSNIIPHDVHELCSRYMSGDTVFAQKLQLSQIKLCKALFSEVNPIPVKTACEVLGICRSTVRLPLCEMNENNLVKLRGALVEYGLIK